MATVETVNGPVDVEELGLTLIHEHFRTTDEAMRFQFPHLYDEDAEWEAAMRRRQRRSRATASRRSSSRARCSSTATPPSASGWPTRAA